MPDDPPIRSETTTWMNACTRCDTVNATDGTHAYPATTRLQRIPTQWHMWARAHTVTTTMTAAPALAATMRTLGTQASYNYYNIM